MKKVFICLFYIVYSASVMYLVFQNNLLREQIKEMKQGKVTYLCEQCLEKNMLDSL